MIKKIINTLTILLVIFSCNKKKESNSLSVIETNKIEEKDPLLGKKALIYTTAQNTTKRLSLDLKNHL